MTHESPAAIELRLLRETVACLLEEQQHLHRRMVAREDRRIGEALLPLVAELVGDQVITGPSLVAVALNDRTGAGQAVREIVPDCGTDAGGLRAFGRLLQRLDGVPLAGHRLVPAGESREGLRWRVVRVSRP